MAIFSKEKTAFIADLGKVLIDYDWNIMLDRIEKCTGRPLIELGEIFSSRHQDKLLKKFCRGQMSCEEFYKNFCEVFMIDSRQMPFNKFVWLFTDLLTGEVREITKLLPLFKKYFELLIMITNTNALHFDFAKRKLPRVFKYFDLVIASHEVGFLKPEREIYNFAIQFMKSRNITPEKSLFVDDNLKNLEGARMAGIGQTFQFYPGKEQEFKKYLKNHWQITVNY